MNNFIKLSCTFVYPVTFVFFWSFRIEASKPNVTDINFNEAPRTLYPNNCACSHGADGRSQTELGRLNDTPEISGDKARKMIAAKISRLISSGKGSMPGFGKKLSRGQVSNIANYVREL